MRVVAARDVRRRDALPPPQIALASARLDAQRVAGERNPSRSIAAGAGGGKDCGHGREFNADAVKRFRLVRHYQIRGTYGTASLHRKTEGHSYGREKENHC